MGALRQPKFGSFNDYVMSCYSKKSELGTLTCYKCIFSSIYRVFQKFFPIVNCILRKVFNASLGKCKLIQVRTLSK